MTRRSGCVVHANAPVRSADTGRRAAAALCRKFWVGSLLAVLAFAVTATLPLPSARSAGADLATPENLVRQFGQIAFSAEIGGQYRAGRLIKWEQPIRARVFGFEARPFLPEVEEHLARLRRLSGLPIAVLRDLQSKANLNIWLLPASEIYAWKRSGPCYTEVWTSDSGFDIVAAHVYIATDEPNMRRHCILEELSQSLGLTNDSSLFRASIFNDASFLTRLEPWDEQMIYMLYDPRLRPGMTFDQALPAVRSIANGIVASRPY